ncbi:MAG: hypothetical protein Q9164_006515 [Protoblastenia rupestris]
MARTKSMPCLYKSPAWYIKNRVRPASVCPFETSLTAEQVPHGVAKERSTAAALKNLVGIVLHGSAGPHDQKIPISSHKQAAQDRIVADAVALLLVPAKHKIAAPRPDGAVQPRPGTPIARISRDRYPSLLPQKNARHQIQLRRYFMRADTVDISGSRARETTST